jgi:hypothetical protein
VTVMPLIKADDERRVQLTGGKCLGWILTSKHALSLLALMYHIIPMKKLKNPSLIPLYTLAVFLARLVHRTLQIKVKLWNLKFSQRHLQRV